MEPWRLSEALCQLKLCSRLIEWNVSVALSLLKDGKSAEVHSWGDIQTQVQDIYCLRRQPVT